MKPIPECGLGFLNRSRLAPICPDMSLPEVNHAIINELQVVLSKIELLEMSHCDETTAKHYMEAKSAIFRIVERIAPSRLPKVQEGEGKSEAENISVQ